MEVTSKIPMEFEPKRPHRFLVYFPEIMEIDNFLIKGLSKLSYNFKLDEYDDLTFIIYDVIGENLTAKIVETLINTRKHIIRIEIASLDPVGIEIERFEIVGNLLDVDLGTYDYDYQDELSFIKIKIKPSDINSIKPKKRD